MINPTVAFLNLCWWSTEPSGKDDGVSYLRKGTRAGSRWPFTSRAHAAPGSKNVQLGSYLPAPFFLQSAAAWTQRAFPDAHVMLRDSVARYESIQEFSDWWCEATPSHVIIETGTPCWQNDYAYIKQLKKSNPKVQIAIAGPNTREVAAHPVPEVDAYIYGEYDKGAAAFVGGKRGVIPFTPLSREELRNVPYPMFDEPVAHHYADSNPGQHPWPELTVWASRGCNHLCLSGDTPVDTIYGAIPIRELAEKGEPVPVFTYISGEKRARVSTAYNAQKTGEGKQLVRVNFDDGSHIDCTPDHKFLSFKWGNQFVGEREAVCEAKDLKPGVHLRALKRYDTPAGYPTCAWARSKTTAIHRLVAEWKLGRRLLPKEVVHHKDHNKKNFHPDNLLVCADSKEHHAQHPENAERMRTNNPVKNMTPEWRAKIRASQTGLKRSAESKERYRLAAIKREAAKSPEQKRIDADRMHTAYMAQEAWKGRKPRTKKAKEPAGELINHRVVSVEELPGLHDVYCLEVPDTGWFYANKVLVKNCNFCSFPATMTNDDPLGHGGRKIRFYDPAWLDGFIRHRIAIAARSGLPLQAVRFDGDLENSSDKHTKEICRVMRSIGLPWSMMCRADTTSREVWQEMKDSGCFGVKIGFESASDRIVNEVVGKKLDLKAAEETCRFLRSIGMAVHTTWMIGSHGELPAEQKLTIDTIRRFYVENVHTSHQLSATAQIDGTPLANMVKSDPNYIVDSDGQHKIETLLSK